MIPILKINQDIHTIKLFEKNNISVHLLRLDEIHPVVSGNKLFKLYYFLKDVLHSPYKTIITFGGAYSNHLAATAFACNQLNIKSIGFVRGEQPKTLSPTLEFCIQNNMQLEFIDRVAYKTIHEKKFSGSLFQKFGNHILIPEGGFSLPGMEGAKLIWKYIEPNNKYTHICCAIGTATTFAGLINGNTNDTIITGLPVLKGLHDIEERLIHLKILPEKKYKVIYDYHFGGYAKRNDELIHFINSFYSQNHIPLDFVYTGKMMYGVYDLINKNYFPGNSNILCIHTGGLQGNNSLPDGTLKFTNT